MRGFVLGVFLAVLGVSAVVAADTGDAINGTWLTADGTSKVQVSNANGAVEGRVVWLKDPQGGDGQPKVDRLNPDASLRSRPVMGLAVLTGFHYAGNNVWDGGTVYTPSTGKSYPCKLTLAPDGSLKLTVGGGVFGRTLTWTRA
jgi:uncharacterized protein (DUF2147 family)